MLQHTFFALIHGNHGFNKCFSKLLSIFSHVVSSSNIIVAFPCPKTQIFQSPGYSSRAKIMAYYRKCTSNRKQAPYFLD